jgi:hypothetical protein
MKNSMKQSNNHYPNPKQSSERTSSDAGRALSNPHSSQITKELAGAVLAQAPYHLHPGITVNNGVVGISYEASYSLTPEELQAQIDRALKLR